MSASIRPVAVTVNLQGKTVELQQLGEDALFGRASYGKYAYAVGCERLFGLLDRHGIKATVFVPGAEAEANPDYVASLARRGHEIASHGYSHRLLTGMEPAEFEAAFDRGALRRNREDDQRRASERKKTKTETEGFGVRPVEGPFQRDHTDQEKQHRSPCGPARPTYHLCWFVLSNEQCQQPADGELVHSREREGVDRGRIHVVVHHGEAHDRCRHDQESTRQQQPAARA